MSIVEIFLIGVGLSMDALSVAICKGLSLGKITIKEMIIVGLWFGIFQALMPVIGYYSGIYFADLVTQVSHYIAFVLLALIGGNMIKESFDTDADCSPSLKASTMFLLALATSIDALAVGVSFAFLRVNIIEASSLIGVTTFFLSALGVKIGSLFGIKYKNKAEMAGGIILILIGLKILLEGLGIL